MTDRIYSVYNVCGISGRCSQNEKWYKKCLETIFSQKTQFEHLVIISACKSDKKVLYSILDEFPVYVYYISDKIPVNPSFNSAVLESVKRWGPASSYLYIDSGIKFNSSAQLQQLCDTMNNGLYSMVAAAVDDDGGYDQWFGNKLPEGDIFVVPIGSALNLHCQLFSHSLLAYYNKLLPDIFAGHCSESVLSFLAAAISTYWVLDQKVVVSHKKDIDGQSSGFSPLEWIKQGKSRFDQPFIIPSVIERILKCGDEVGFEECNQIIMHNPAKYDPQGFCINGDFKRRIKENLFLTEDEFDYSNINSFWLS